MVIDGLDRLIVSLLSFPPLIDRIIKICNVIIIIIYIYVVIKNLLVGREEDTKKEVLRIRHASSVENTTKPPQTAPSLVKEY
jgi:hypothetical protein